MVCASSWNCPTGIDKKRISLPLRFRQDPGRSGTGVKKDWLFERVPVTFVCPFFVEVRAGTPLSICYDIGGGSLPLPQIVCRKIAAFQLIIVINHNNEQNVLRVEMTMNDPSKFRVHRHKLGQSKNESKSRLPLRKGVADIPLRAKISQEANERFMKDLAGLHDKTPIHELFRDITLPRNKSGRSIRALDPTGKDRDLLQAISDPVFRISGLTNKMLRQQLQKTQWAKGRNDKQLSARVSRHLALLRNHGIIKKLPRQNRYHLTQKGTKLTTALNALLAASTEQLLDLAA